MRIVIGWFRHNLWYKLVALVLAVALWTYVGARENPLVTAEVVLPVQVEGVGEGMVATRIAPESRKVRLRGRKTVVERLVRESGPARLVAYVTGLGPGERMVAVEPAGLPAGLRADWDSGPVVSVTLETLVERRAEVTVLPRGGLPEGFRLVDASAAPPEVTVRGAAAEVEAVQKVTAAVRISALTQTSQVTVPLRALRADNSPANVQLIPPQVNLRLVIAPAPKKTVRVVVRYGHPPAGYQVLGVSVEPSGVTIVSRGADLSRVTSVPTETISLSSATTTITRTARLRVPNGLAVEGAASVRVTIRIAERPAPVEVTPPGGEAAGAVGEGAPAPESTRPPVGEGGGPAVDQGH